MGFQQQTVVFVGTAKVYQNTALGGDSGFKAQAFEGIFYPGGGPGGEAGGGVDGEQGSCLLPGKIRVREINHIVLLEEYSARHRPLPA